MVRVRKHAIFVPHARVYCPVVGEMPPWVGSWCQPAGDGSRRDRARVLT